MKWINDIEPLYQKGIIERDGLYVCGVCSKEYKRYSSALKHLEKQSCHSYVQLLKGTLTEELMYTLYTSILNELGNNYSIGMVKFREKTRMYNALAKYLTYTQKHSLTNGQVIDYFLYVYFNKANNISQAANYAKDNNILKEFRQFMIKNHELIDSKTFYDKNKDKITSDTSFTIRSIERGEISIYYILDHVDDKFCEKLSKIEQNRLEEVLSVMGG